MIILGISCFFHDSSACILNEDSVIAAAAEERFTRIKHDNSFPEQAIAFCLKEANIAINELSGIAFYEKPLIKFDRILYQHLQHFPKSYSSFSKAMPSWIQKKLNIKDLLREKFSYYGDVFFVPHHLSHAASSFYLSPFESAAIVTLDGVGEWATSSIAIGEKNAIEIKKEIHFPHSIGLLYSTITAFLGFKVNSDEYKVMGLAAYGNYKKYLTHFRHMLKLFDDGSYQLNMNYFDFNWAEHMPNRKMAALFGFGIRSKSEAIMQKHADIAATLQFVTERAVFNMLNNTFKDHSNLCLSGGVALNSVMNGKILSNTSFSNLYIPPDPSDGGGAMGAALETLFRLGAKTNARLSIQKNFTPYLGPKSDWFEIEALLKKTNLVFNLYSDDEIAYNAAEILSQNKVLAWFQGRMEWGPRALGNRSFLASATSISMKEKINSQIKKRELFRPFAPAILEEYVQEYFDTDTIVPESSKYMILVYPFKKEKAELVPAVVHEDGTGRLQVVSAQDNPLYYRLIDEYRKRTGIPLIINTSFNVQEPIVCSAKDAIECFLKTDVHDMVIGNYLVSRKK